MDIRVTPGAIYKKTSRVVEEEIVVATETDADWGRLGRVVADLNAVEPCEVALVGLGFGVFPRLAAHYHHLTIFELEPAVVDHFKGNYPWVKADRIIVGDYTHTLPQLERLWNYIVFDVGGEPPAWLSDFGEVIVPR